MGVSLRAGLSIHTPAGVINNKQDQQENLIDKITISELNGPEYAIKSNEPIHIGFITSDGIEKNYICRIQNILEAIQNDIKNNYETF